MIETSIKNLYVIEPNTKPSFPNGVVLFYNGDEKFLIDLCLDAEELSNKLKKFGVGLDEIDYVFLTHLHPDHAKKAYKLREEFGIKIFLNELEAKYAQTWEKFFEIYGISKYPKLVEEWLKNVGNPLGFKPFKVDRIIRFGKEISIDDLVLEPIHSPGHTIGHTFFRIGKLLVLGDIDLTDFPWYGHPSSNLKKFIESTRMVLEMKPAEVVSMHRGLIKSGVEGEILEYLKIVEDRNKLLLMNLSDWVSVDELVGRGIIYRRHYGNITKFFERNMIVQHLKYLKDLGFVEERDFDGVIKYRVLI